MNYHRYYPVDVVNGPGTRCALFVAGCIHKCQGCYNKSTWRPDSGKPFTQEVEDKIIADLKDKRIHRQGLSLSGGDPLYPGNVPAVLKLVQRVRAECPGKDIWAWTGYTIDELDSEQMAVVDLVDVLIDGRFVEALKDANLVWRGSSNQVIHDLRKERQIPKQEVAAPVVRADLSAGVPAAQKAQTRVAALSVQRCDARASSSRQPEASGCDQLSLGFSL